MAEFAQVPLPAVRSRNVLDLPRHTVLVRTTHWIHTFSFLALVISGGAILLAHPRLYWGETGALGSRALIELPIPLIGDHSGWGRSLHFLAAWICVLNGMLYALCALLTRHFRRDLLPSRAELKWRSILDIISKHLHLKKPGEEEYNVVQRLAYIAVVFALFPLIIVSGLAMSPAVAAALPAVVGIFGGHQSARTIHFFATALLVLFLIVHVAMVWLAGFRSRMRLMITGRGAARTEHVSNSLTRRTMIGSALGASAVASASGVAVLLAKRYGLVPPDHGGLFGVGETLTYGTQRVLLCRQPLAREFSRDRVSKNFPAINTVLPEDASYRWQMTRGFEGWRLEIDGLIASPSDFSLADLKRFPSRTQITQHICEAGWSAIAEWTGVPLSLVLNEVGIRPEAKYVVLYSVDGWWDSLDMQDAWHPQTLLAYGMNGQDLPVPHGAPVRLRVERQLGYKNLKYLSAITVTDSLADFGKGQGALGAENGYSWYAGI
jgi:DMSO/TMAO reductase YedYZ molybdopterin-dependent catalytic subunit/thiosulfate reductase cytochrome b subunit